MPDKGRIRSAFDRAAPGFDEADFLHRDIRDRLLSRLDILRIDPDRVLDLGAGTGNAFDGLAARFPDTPVIAIDFAANMLAAGRNREFLAVCADAARLPIEDQSVDLIFSNLMLQYCPDPGAVFEEARRALRFPGVLIFSTLGPDSLIELRAAWAKADEHSHVTEFLDMHHVGDALVHAGFAEPVLDVEKITITYEQLPRLMADLRGVGSINATTHRNRGLTGRRAWQRMNDTYETFRNAEARLPLTLEIVFGLAWRGPPASGRRTPDGDVEIPVDRIFPRD